MSDKDVVHKNALRDSFVSPRRAKKLKLLTDFLSKQESRNTFKLVSKALKKSELERTDEEGALLKKNHDVVKRIHKNKERKLKSEQRVLETEDSEDILEAKCAQLAAAIKRSKNAVIYTGAGISTAASIPDYRGPQGVWTLLQRGEQLPAQDLSDAEPTVTHMCIAQLHKLGKVKHVVSQNCDGLHLRSGMARRCLSEVHGNMFIELCHKCRPHREYVRLFDVTENTGVRKHYTGRHCHKCRGKLQDTIVHFGEKGGIKAPYRWKEAARAANKCDLILCLGSSLKILRRYPCLWSMDRIKSKRPKLFVINLQWTPKDDSATLKINGRCDDVITRVMKILDYTIPVYTRDTDQIFQCTIPMTSEEMETTSKKVLKVPENIDSHPSTDDTCVTDSQEGNPSTSNVHYVAEATVSKMKQDNGISSKRLLNIPGNKIHKLTKEEVNFLKSQEICNAAKHFMQKKLVKKSESTIHSVIEQSKPVCQSTEYEPHSIDQSVVKPATLVTVENATECAPAQRYILPKADSVINKHTTYLHNGFKCDNSETEVSPSSNGNILYPDHAYQMQQLLKLGVLQSQLETLKQCREELRNHNTPNLDVKVKVEQPLCSPTSQSLPNHKQTHDRLMGQSTSPVLKALATEAMVNNRTHPSLANIERDEMLMNEIANSHSEVQKQRFTEWAESRVQNIDKSCSDVVRESTLAPHRNGFEAVNIKQTAVKNEVCAPRHLDNGSEFAGVATCQLCSFLRDYGITKRRCISCDMLNTHGAQEMNLLNSTYPNTVEHTSGEKKSDIKLLAGTSISQVGCDKDIVTNHMQSHINASLPIAVLPDTNLPVDANLCRPGIDLATMQCGDTAYTVGTSTNNYTLSAMPSTSAGQMPNAYLVNSVLYDHFYLKPHEMQKLSPDNRPSHTQSCVQSTVSNSTQNGYIQPSTSVDGPQNLLTSDTRRESLPVGTYVSPSTNSLQTQSLPSISSFMSNSATNISVIVNTHTSQEHSLLKLSLKREPFSEPESPQKHGKPSSAKKKQSPDKWFISSGGSKPEPKPPNCIPETCKTQLDFDNHKAAYHRSVSISEHELSREEIIHAEPVHRSYSQSEIDMVSVIPALETVTEAREDNSIQDEEQGSKPEKKRKLVKQLSIPGWFGKGLNMKKRRKYKY